MEQSAPEPGPIVLGAQLAAARVAEQRHRETNAAPSPLVGVAYDAAGYVTWRWVEQPTDATVLTIARGFADQDAATVRASLRMEDFYLLMMFTRRLALRALREDRVDDLPVAFDVLALIDLARIDWRDAVVAAGVVCYAAERLGLDPAAEVARVVDRAGDDTASLLEEVSEDEIDLSEMCGMTVVDTPAGTLLLDDDDDPYDPVGDLVSRALALADLLDHDRYAVRDVTMRTAIADVWLGGRGTRAAGTELTGCVGVHADLRPPPEVPGDLPGDGDGDARGDAFLLAYVAEAATPADAALVAQTADASASDVAVQLGVARGCLVVVLIASSGRANEPPPETRESLARLRAPITALLTASP